MLESAASNQYGDLGTLTLIQLPASGKPMGVTTRQQSTPTLHCLIWRGQASVGDVRRLKPFDEVF